VTDHPQDHGDRHSPGGPDPIPDLATGGDSLWELAGSDLQPVDIPSSFAVTADDSMLLETQTSTGGMFLTSGSEARLLALTGDAKIVTAVADVVLDSADDVTITADDDMILFAAGDFQLSAVGTTLVNGRRLPYNEASSVGTVSNTGTGETDLVTHTLSAGLFAFDGGCLHYHVGGNYTGHATATQRIRAYLGGSVMLDTGALAVTNLSSWSLDIYMVRGSSSVIVYDAILITDGTAARIYQSTSNIGSLTLSGTLTLKVTGQAAGVGATSSQVQRTHATGFYRQ
jgi:hypothetical protein